MSNGNDGLRFTLDRRGGKYHWSFTDLGELHESGRGFDSLVLAAQSAETYHRQVKLSRDFKKQRLSANSPSL